MSGRKAQGLLAAMLLTVLPAPILAEVPLIWPTPNRAWLEGRPPAEYLQPTASGRLESALYGCVRNGGARFHEAIDLKAIHHRSDGEAADLIYAAMPGVVRHVSKVAGYSSYGKYIVLEHPNVAPAVYTLYSHLREIRRGITPGRHLEAGTVLGTMGRSAGGYTIPKDRAHLHFEVGLRLSNHFQQWFDAQDYPSPNRHGNWNGMNLAGLDPLLLYEAVRAGRVADAGAFVRAHRPALFLRYHTTRVPDFVARYPTLLEGPVRPRNVVAWEIGLTRHGVPVSLEARHREDLPRQQATGTLELIRLDEKALRSTGPCVSMVDGLGDRRPRPTPFTRRRIEMLFPGDG
jgi:murein DD-endopeptidase MepM/ murein hydrolase activator NlpD